MDNRLDLINGNVANSLLLNNMYGNKSNELLLNMPIPNGTSLTVTSQGSGTGVGQLYLTVSKPLTLTLDGNAYFYTDVSGTAGQSSSTDITTYGSFVYRYFKCTSGTSNLTFSDNTAMTYLGDINSGGGGWPGYTWAGSSSISNIPILNMSNWNFPNCTHIGIFYSQICHFDGSMSAFSSSLERILLSTTGTFNYNISEIPSTCTQFFTNAGNGSGNISTLPPNIKELGLSGVNTVTGDIANLPSSLYWIYALGTNTITGDISTFKSTMVHADIEGNNTLYGDISNIDASMTLFYIQGSNTITGDIGTLKPAINTFYVTGNSSIYGNVANLPSSITQVFIQGYNTVTGDIANFPSTLRFFGLYGSNTLYGDIRNLNLNINNLQVYGNNTLSGVLDSSIHALTSLSSLMISGKNTISGDLALAPPNLYGLQIDGSSTINTYTAGRVWSNSFNYLYFNPVSPGGLNSTKMDNLFIDVSASVRDLSSAGYYGTLYLKGSNAAPTAASLVARTALTAEHYNITTN